MEIIQMPKEQRKLVRLICAIQIRNLGDAHDDVIEVNKAANDYGVDEHEFRGQINSCMDRFLEVHADPKLLLLALSNPDRDTFKHIMNKFIKHPKYIQVKRALWNKFRISETPYITPN